MINILDVEKKLKDAQTKAKILKEDLDWLRENDFTLDTDALHFIYDLGNKLDSLEIKGEVVK